MTNEGSKSVKVIGESVPSLHHEEHEGHEAQSDSFLQVLHVLHGSFSPVKGLAEPTTPPLHRGLAGRRGFLAWQTGTWLAPIPALGARWQELSSARGCVR